MPRVRNMDISHRDADEARWIAPPGLLVRERTQVHDSGTNPTAKDGRCSTRNHKECAWPFLYSYRDGHCIVNKAPRQSAYAQADIGEALM